MQCVKPLYRPPRSVSNILTGHHRACQTSSQVTTKRVKCLNGSERVSNVLTGQSGCQTSLQVRARVKRLFQVRPLVKRLYRSKRLSAVFTGQSTCQAPSQVTQCRIQEQNLLHQCRRKRTVVAFSAIFCLLACRAPEAVFTSGLPKVPAWHQSPMLMTARLARTVYGFCRVVCNKARKARESSRSLVADSDSVCFHVRC